MNYVQELSGNVSMFFHFMKEKYPVFNNSNVFFRDLQYAIHSYFEKKGEKLSYSLSEKTALEFVKILENGGQLISNGKNSWKVNFSLDSNVTDIN